MLIIVQLQRHVCHRQRRYRAWRHIRAHPTQYVDAHRLNIITWQERFVTV